MSKRAFAILFGLVIAVILVTDCRSASSKQGLMVAVAISLGDAFNELKTQFERENPDVAIVYNLAASGTIQVQLEQGAPADLVALASVRNMEALEAKGLLMTNTKRDFASNSLALVVPKGARARIAALSGLTDPSIRRIALGNPDIVPVGQYAREALFNLGLWERVRSKVVYAENARQALAYVETGEVDAAIVFRTDALSSHRVNVVEEIPQNLHTTVVYSLAITAKSSKSGLARRYIDFLLSQDGQQILRRYGFKPVP